MKFIEKVYEIRNKQKYAESISLKSCMDLRSCNLLIHFSCVDELP